MKWKNPPRGPFLLLLAWFMPPWTESSTVAPSTTHPMRIHAHYGSNLDTQGTPNSTQKLVRRVLLPAAIDWLEKAVRIPGSTNTTLHVKRACESGYYVVNKESFCKGLDKCVKTTSCGVATVPTAHLAGCRSCDVSLSRCQEEPTTTPGVMDRDLILYVTAIETTPCQTESIISHSFDCQQEKGTDRPNVGNLNICPNRVSYLEKDYYWQIQYLIHDIMHILAFAPRLFSFFRDPNGVPLTPRNAHTGLPVQNPQGDFAWGSGVIASVSDSYKNWEVASGKIVRSANFLVTPKVKAAVQEHFNCYTLAGAELETQKHSYFHWENRMFQSDIMTGQSGRKLVISKISLAVLEDSGWYSVDYDYAQKLSWGKGLGCRFATSSCLGYMNSQAQVRQSENPFCRSRPSPSVVTCNVDRTAVAQCNIKDYKNALPAEFQYFSGTKDFTNRTGGGDDQADYCPYYEAFKVDDQRDSNCYIKSNAPDKNVALETYGPGSRCLNHGRKWFRKEGSRTDRPERNWAGCYKISCLLQQLRVSVGGKWYTCSSKGQQIYIDMTVDGAAYSGSIVCPAFSEVCEGYGCPKDCSHHGRCTSSQTCVCDPGYYGNDCSSSNFDTLQDCASQPCQNNGQCKPKTSGDGYTCNCLKGTSGSHCEHNADECASSPCQNGGTCTDHIGRFSCACRTGYNGTRCERDVKECASNPCQNGGQCIDGIGGYSCICSPGYFGLHCNVKAVQCAICLNGGKCRNDGSNLCDCAIGYAGVICQSRVDYCSPQPCQNSGTCTMTKTGYACACTNDFKGVNCDTPIVRCATNPCQNGATCKDTSSGFECKCPNGYEGDRCDHEIDECLSSPCLNNATCTDLVANFVCNCRTGFSGTYCGINVDDCDPNPCRNHGICYDLVAGYLCECQDGFEGATCETNIDECASNVGDPIKCYNGGTCKDGNNEFTCACAVGYTGRRCETELNECTSNPCQNGATCVDGVAGYRCQCASGHGGVHCEKNVDECASSPCLNGGRCVDLLDGYTCNCSTGYIGLQCQIDVDDCVGVAHGCLNGATCVDGVNSYTCACTTGYTGLKCELKVDACETEPCGNGGTCVSTSAGHFLCFCSSDFSGLLCESEIDSCASSPCPSGSQCIDHRFGYSCDECVARPCHNGGRCVDTPNGFDCHCLPGFAGVRCAIDVNECDSEPCANGGTCIDGANGFTCVCASGYVGFQCERDANECASSPCLNNGLCLDQANGFECQCRDGYSGTRCEWPPGDCRASSCANGGTCAVTSNGTWECSCPVGFAGPRCDFALVDECTSSPCLNNGTCVDKIDGYECVCCAGYTGADCAVNIDDCSSNLCQNGALCVDGVNGYSCVCPRRYVGPFCTEAYDPCSMSPCRNNGTCLPTTRGKSSTCDCPHGYAGKRCQFKLSPDCVDMSCDNGGMCIERLNGRAKCRCPSGYSGARCEIVTDPCAAEPCLNGGRCLRNDDYAIGYECRCTDQFEGKRCEMLRGACRPNPCRNGGACLEDDSARGYACVCAFGYRGSRCDKRANPCDGKPCRNGGTCRRAASGSFKCSCAYPYAGETCADEIATPSFDAKSFLSLKPQLHGVRSSFSLSFSFNPREKDGVLILTSEKRSGSGNYLALALANGNVEFRFDFGSGEQVLVSEDKVTLDRWHTVNVRCGNDFQELSVDSQTPVRRQQDAQPRNLKLSRRIFVGYKNEKEFAVRGYGRSFSGCLSDLTINSLAVPFNATLVLQSIGVKKCDCNDECDANDACRNGGTCVHTTTSDGNVCACPHGFAGPTCDRSSLFAKPRFSITSYLLVPTPKASGKSVALFFALRPSGPDGLVLHMSEFESGAGDFVVVYLSDGYLVYGFDSGSGATWLRSKEPLAMGQDYLIAVKKERQRGYLEVDNVLVATGDAKGPFETISLRRVIYVGGVPPSRSIPDAVASRSGLVGCLWSLSVNYDPVDLSSDNPDARAVDVGDCGGSSRPACSAGQQESRLCVRNLDFETPSFSGASYLQYAHLSQSSRYNRWTLEFKPTTANGTIIYVDQVGNATEDYLYVTMVNSFPLLRVRLGGGSEGEIASDSPISLRSWHTLDVTRNDNVLVMAVDEQKFNGISPGRTTTMSTNQEIFLGGLPHDGAARRASAGLGMVGCIRSLHIDGVALVLRDSAIDGQSIRECLE
ncbi:uncharacterized protein [Oscarella lobularis]|uniref:uncharacterized protein n=1 Tax=Oscarella lobularis TaxID=121494 RepID=UPI003313E798